MDTEATTPTTDPETKKSLLSRIFQLPATLLILSVKLYQCTLGPLFLGGHCRFEPSCSHYFIQAVEKYGAVKGGIKGILRICRCHPFCSGGYDPP
ncbi:membrane protein insertion efficiency factor YidD [bacterium]|nr:membrane protein insertion efficiency factor YidD [Planctomicrobium sp.]MDA7503984.1 membrane protein insertion efficiency factor YidD [bacterium]